MLSKRHLIDINSGVVKGVCYEYQDTCFTFMALKVISVTEDKGPNIIIKDDSIAHIT